MHKSLLSNQVVNFSYLRSDLVQLVVDLVSLQLKLIEHVFQLMVAAILELEELFGHELLTRLDFLDPCIDVLINLLKLVLGVLDSGQDLSLSVS